MIIIIEMLVPYAEMYKSQIRNILFPTKVLWLVCFFHLQDIWKILYYNINISSVNMWLKC